MAFSPGFRGCSVHRVSHCRYTGGFAVIRGAAMPTQEPPFAKSDAGELKLASGAVLQAAEALGLHTVWFRDARQCEVKLEHLLGAA
jgi:hypothetical protein